MSLMMRVFKPSLIVSIFTLATPSPGDIDKTELVRKFASIKTADHGVIFTRLSDGKVLFEQHADDLM